MIAVMYIRTRMVHAVVSIISVIPVIAIRELGIFLSFDVFFFFYFCKGYEGISVLMLFCNPS